MTPAPPGDALRNYFRGLAARDLAGLTDARLLAGYVEGGDAAAFEALVRRHGPMVYGVCRRVLAGHQDAEDAFQATFLVLARKAAAVAPREFLPNWLHGVAHTTALQARRAAARRRAHEYRYALRPAPDAPESAGDDLGPLLDRELGRLPERYRVAVVLCDLEGKTRTEAARQLSWPEGTVAGTLARARTLLAARLTRRGVTLAGVPLATLLPADAVVAAAVTASLSGPSAGPVAALTHGVLHAMLLTKLKAAFAAFAAVAVVGYGASLTLPAAASASGQEAPKPVPAAKPADAPKAVPAAGHAVAGRVVRASDGSAVAGADVHLLYDETTATPRPTTRVKSDADGMFAFAGVARGKYTLQAFVGGLTSRTEMIRGLRVVAPVAPDAKPIVLTMKPGNSLKVRVVSEATGKPIPGAQVGFFWTDVEAKPTDAKGEVEFPALTKELWTAQATAAGYARVTRAVNLESGEPAALELKLPPGAAVVGVVRDGDGKPVAGVGIDARAANPDFMQCYLETDPAGRFHFDHLPVGQGVTLTARQLKFETATKELKLTAGQAEPTRIDVTLTRRPHGGSVTGVVTDAQGKPVAGARLRNTGNSSDAVRQATTDAAGHYTLDDVYATSTGHEFVARAEGLAPRVVAFKPGTAAAPADADVKLEAGHRVRGRVVDPSGMPLANALVDHSGGLSPVGGVGEYVPTDKEGRFRFTSLPATAPFGFSKEGFTPIEGRTLPLDGADEVVVTMQPAGVVVGTALDAVTGKPIARFNVSLTFSPDHKEGDTRWWLPGKVSGTGQVFASARGDFRLGDLPAGMPLQVTVTAEGYRKRVVRRLLATPDAKPTEFRLTPEDPATLVTYAGKVVNGKGAGVASVELRLVAAGPRGANRTDFPFNWQMVAETGQVADADGVFRYLSGTTAADGTFEFRGVPPDAEVELVYWGQGVPGGRADRLDRLPAAGRTAVVVKALAPASVSGTIDRKAFPEIDHVLLSGGSRFHRATLSADGTTFTADDLPPGKYEVQVYGRYRRVEGAMPGMITNDVLARRPLTLTEGERGKVTIGASSP